MADLKRYFARSTQLEMENWLNDRVYDITRGEMPDWHLGVLLLVCAELSERKAHRDAIVGHPTASALRYLNATPAR